MTGIGALLAACGQPSPTATPTPAATLSPVEQGEQLFATKGCSACHGRDAAGTGIAPALAGHSSEQVRRQVRNPLGSMPAFGPGQISEAELELLVAYVESLETQGAHSEPAAIPPGDAVAMHHWMALTALAAERVDEAAHHVAHAIELIEDAEHRRAMEAVASALEAGRLHDAEHEIEAMLAGTAEPALSEGELHLQLALGAAHVHDGPEVRHHLEHFMSEADEQEREGAREALEHIDAGDEEAAGRVIIELLEAMEHEHHRHD